MTLITVSGLDGAGKSTLVASLQRDLESRSRRVTVLHQNDHVGIFAWTRALRDRVRGWSPPPDAPPRLGPSPTRLGRIRDQVIWSPILRSILYPIDLLLFLGYRAWIELVRGRVLLMDRYFYDTLVDLATRGPRRPAFGWLRLTPTPDLAVLLDVAPEEAFGRKREYTVEYLARRADAYRALFPRIPTAVRLHADSADAVRAAAVAALRKRVG
jgi:thymidylate kinase